MCVMCDGPIAADGRKMGRRGLLAGLGAAGVMMGLAACGNSGEPSASGRPVATIAGQSKLELILLGTQAGPPPNPERAGISTALVVDGDTYLVDCGRAAVSQFAKSGLRFSSIRSIFLTHLHIDHLADYSNFFTLAVLGGFNDDAGVGANGPVGIYGPGPAGGLPPKFGGGPVTVVAPDSPTPGTRAMTDDLVHAFAYSNNVFIRDSGGHDITTLMDVHDIEIPAVGADFTNRAPAMQSFPVMRDDKVTVSAILVPHGPVFPAFAFRFDTAYGSVTFSGDTTYTDNIPTLARDSDVLVHEAINLQGVKLPAAVQSHMLESHVEIQKVGGIAQKAGAKKLVLTHLADLARPHLDPTQWHEWAKTGYDGDVVVGNDLQRIVLA